MNPLGFTTDEVDAFSKGDCGYLALALHKETGWQILTISPVEARDTDYWYHVGVRMPDGKILDIKGTWTEDQFRDWWDSETYEVEIYPRDIEWATKSVQKRPPKFSQYDASVYARRLLESLQP